MEVSAANNCNIFRNPQSCLQNMLDCTHSQRIVVAENSIWPRFEFQELAHGFRTVLSTMFVNRPVGDNIAIGKAQTLLSKSTFITLQPLNAWAVLGTTNMRN